MTYRLFDESTTPCCKSYSNHRVVETLETMSHEPEAARYDADVEEWDRREKAAGLTGEMGAHWGKLATIEEQARQIAANK